MTDTTIVDVFAFYARIGAALFPIPAGQKNPTGIVASFVNDCSADPEQWERWREQYPGCNFGMPAGLSHKITIDIDCKQGREAAWALWCELCAEWGITPITPHVQSARGGWHVIFEVPEGVDARTLRQPDAIKGLINIRAGNGFTVAAGSYYDGTAKGEQSGPYLLLSDAQPFLAPQALVDHCLRRAPGSGTVNPNVGTRDIGDVAGLVRWLTERDAFTAYEDWCGIGMALKLEFGDAGLAVWEIAHDDTVTPDVKATKWQSFATEPTAGVQTLNSWLRRAKGMGWTGTVQKSLSAMFGGVVPQMAAAAGAVLPDGAVAMGGGEALFVEHCKPILESFLANTQDLPLRPGKTDYPQLPDNCAFGGLRDVMRESIDRVMAMADTPKAWKPSRVEDALAVLSRMHADVYSATVLRLKHAGKRINDTAIRQRGDGLSEEVLHKFHKQTNHGYSREQRSGMPETDNPDNVVVLLGQLACELRWNAWLERMEIRGDEWTNWTKIDDAVVAELMTRAKRTGTRFRPGKDFMWDTLLALARKNPIDPALDVLAELQAAWDGKSRLSIWLSAVCNVPAEPYHQAVGRLVIGGMVRRIRKPGCKLDEIAIFYGLQGTGKSTLAKLLCPNEAWFSDEIMLGDASKELVLSLAGKAVVEIAEMGMRGSANANHVKAMLSRQVDRGRTAYARTVTDRPRRNIFVGTTNDDEPLSDPTGNRRFLPIRVDNELNLAWLQENVGQLIGEAAHLEANGETFAIPREVWADATEKQEAARSETSTEILLDEWFAETPFASVAYITAADLEHLSTIAQWRGNNATRSATMKRLGFRKEQPYLGGKKTRVWFRGPAANPKHIEREGVRYMVGTDNSGRPKVTISIPAQPG